MGRRFYGGAQADGLPPLRNTVNDLPSPSGSWATQYQANQRKYNAQLIGGIGFLTGTIVFGKAVGIFEFYNDIPDRPADIPSYR